MMDFFVNDGAAGIDVIVLVFLYQYEKDRRE